MKKSPHELVQRTCGRDTTVNQLKGKVTILFITHQLPGTLKVDEVVRLGTPVLKAL
jgi:hypothetical protein